MDPVAFPHSKLASTALNDVTMMHDCIAHPDHPDHPSTDDDLAVALATAEESLLTGNDQEGFITKVLLLIRVDISRQWTAIAPLSTWPATTNNLLTA